MRRRLRELFEIKSAEAKIKSRVEARAKVGKIRNNSRKLKEERLSFNFAVEYVRGAWVCVFACPQKI